MLNSHDDTLSSEEAPLEGALSQALDHDTSSGTLPEGDYQAPALKAGTKRSGKHTKSKLSIAEQASDPSAPPMPMGRQAKKQLVQPQQLTPPLSETSTSLTPVVPQSLDALPPKTLEHPLGVHPSTSIMPPQATTETEAEIKETSPARSLKSSSSPVATSKVPSSKTKGASKTTSQSSPYPSTTPSLQTLLSAWYHQRQAKGSVTPEDTAHMTPFIPEVPQNLFTHLEPIETHMLLLPSYSASWFKHDALNTL
jgi:hypothetical protein